jgi:hypothetical protein
MRVLVLLIPYPTVFNISAIRWPTLTLCELQLILGENLYVLSI